MHDRGNMDSVFSMAPKIREWIADWEQKGYPHGIPDEADAVLERLGKVPSYRRICFAILKNDIVLQSLGFSKPSCEAYNQIKRVEIAERGTS